MKLYLARLVASVAVALAAGCMADYAVDKPLAYPLPATSARVAIVQPADGVDERPKTYEGSGRWVADALQAVLTKRGMSATVGFVPMASASTSGAMLPTYRVTPVIEEWVDRATEWSGKPDTLKIRLTVVDVSTGQTLDDRTITAASKWMTFGGDHPQQMLEDFFSKWADAVFSKPARS